MYVYAYTSHRLIIIGIRIFSNFKNTYEDNFKHKCIISYKYTYIKYKLKISVGKLIKYKLKCKYMRN